jgi:tRNA(adenine34) deaminase
MKASARDNEWMSRALTCALQSTVGDIPIGALVVRGEDLIAGATNNRFRGVDPTAHAEVLALRAAGEALRTVRLDDCDLYVTLEPCPMCAGAAVAARVRRIVFGAWNEQYGACGSVFDIPRDPRMSHRPEVVGGVRPTQSAALVREFLRDRR